MIASLPCELNLPSSWEYFVPDSKTINSGPGERRGFGRHRYCTLAALQYRQTFPKLKRSLSWRRIYTLNRSSSGVLFYHSEQLFPKEQMSIVLMEGQSNNIEIVRCRRLNAKCFEIGARFIVFPDERNGERKSDE
jgi:hypothetical protein